MKKLFTLFLVLVASVGIIYASDTQVDGIWYNFDESNKTASVTYRGSASYDYDGEYSGSVVIPPSVTYNGTTYSVTSIGGGAFYGCGGLTSVTIGNSVTSIGYRAFYYCLSLTSITIPNSVTSIGERAFEHCNFLTSITIPNGVTSIGAYAFTDCYSLTSITIPNSVTSIRGYAFQYCSSLTSVTIPNSVTSIGEWAFNGCSKLTSVTIPNSVTSIGYSAFAGCSSLTSVTIPNSVTSIGGYAFRGCSSLTSIHVDSNNPNYSSVDGVLFNKDKTTLIQYPKGKQGAYTIPNSVTSIGLHAFFYCSSLTSVAIPNSVTSIGSDAFRSCSSLTSVTIPNSVTSIGSHAFVDVLNIEYHGTATGAPWGARRMNAYVEGNLLYEDSTKTTLLLCSYSAQGEIIIPNSVTSIRSSAFRDCSKLTSITIPNSVTSIGDYAFYNCSSLISITCKATTPPTVGQYAFDGVSKSISVHVPCGCVEAYKAANGWKDFTNIREPLAEYSITVGVNATKMGTAKVDINNACGTQISAKPNIGYHFVQWSDGVVNNPRSIVLTQDTVLIAEFAEIPSYVVEVIYNPDHGTVNGQGTYEEDEKVTLTATANDGYRFHKWSNGVTDNPYTFIVKSDVTLEAKFTSTEGIADVLSSEVHTTKVIRDGQVLILRNGKTYTMQGQEVK